MKRSWNVVRYGQPTGDEEALKTATALANLTDAETIRSLLDCLSVLYRYGGEVTISAYRFKFDPDGNRVAPEEVGDFDTAGLYFHVEHVARATRAATQAPVEPDQRIGDPLPLMPELNEDSDGAPVDGEPEVAVPGHV